MSPTTATHDPSQLEALKRPDATVAIARSADAAVSDPLAQPDDADGAARPQFSPGDVSYPFFIGERPYQIAAAKTRVEAGRRPFARSRATSSPRPWRPTWT